MHINDLRIQVRECDDGWVRALMVFTTMPGSSCLLQVPAIPFNASEEVREKFNELAVALLRAAIAEVLPGVVVEDVKVMPACQEVH